MAKEYTGAVDFMNATLADGDPVAFVHYSDLGDGIVKDAYWHVNMMWIAITLPNGKTMNKPAYQVIARR